MDVYEVGKEAVSRARMGEGPTLIEAQTYRYQGHFGADDPLGYRSKEEQEYYMSRDCIVMLQKHILDGAYADETQLEAIDKKCIEAVNTAAEFANNSPFPDSEELTTDVYVAY